MKKTVLMVAVLALLAGCDREGSLERTIRDAANDPPAVQFKDKVMLGDYACISVNGKNAYGGYVGFKRYKMRMFTDPDHQDRWHKESEDGVCTKESLALEEQERENDKKAGDVEAERIFKIVKDLKVIPATANGYLDIKDEECQKAVQSTMTYAEMAVSKKYADDKDTWNAKVQQRLDEFKKGSCKLPPGEQS